MVHNKSKPALFAPAAAALLTLSGCSSSGNENSLFSSEDSGKGKTVSETDIYRESGRK